MIHQMLEAETQVAHPFMRPGCHELPNQVLHLCRLTVLQCTPYQAVRNMVSRAGCRVTCSRHHGPYQHLVLCQLVSSPVASMHMAMK